MSNEREIVYKIHESHFSRRLHILKGFKEVIGTAPVHLSELQKAIGEDEPIYTFDNLQKYANEVLTKGTEDDISKAKEVLGSLKGKEVVDQNGNIGTVYFYVEKALPGKNNLVQKQITDKTGKPTTKWVNPNKGEGEGDDDTEQEEEETEDASGADQTGTKTVVDHAKETPSEHLKKYLQENPDGEHAEHAKAELQARGEDEEGSDQAIDYSDPEAVKTALQDEATQQAVMSLMVEDPSLTAAQALKLNAKTSTNHADTHAKIDAAQAALDDLKTHTGHPGSGEAGNEEGDANTDALIETLADKVFNSQGNLDVEGVKDTYNQLVEAGLSPEQIESEMAPMTWDNPEIEDTEKQGFRDQWDSIIAQLDQDSDNEDGLNTEGEEDEEEESDDNPGNSFSSDNSDTDEEDEEDSDEDDDTSSAGGDDAPFGGSDNSDSDEEEEEDNTGGDNTGDGNEEDEEDQDDPTDDQDGFKFDGSDNTDKVLEAFKSNKVSAQDVAKHFERKDIK